MGGGALLTTGISGATDKPFGENAFGIISQRSGIARDI